MSSDLVAESTHGNLDEQIAQLMQCKPLSEPDVYFIYFLFLFFRKSCWFLVQIVSRVIFYGSDSFVRIGEFVKFSGMHIFILYSIS